MSIVSVDKMWSRDSSSATMDKNGRFTIGFEEAYQVITSADATALEVYQAAGIPAAGSTYPGTNWVVCSVASPQRVSPIMWIVGVSYKGEGDGEATPDPLTKRPEKSWTASPKDTPVDEDFYGRPICTINGERLEGVTRTIHDMILTVRRNYASFSPYLTHAYLEATNSDTFEGYPPGMARMTQFNATEVYTQSGIYWDVSAVIEFRYPYRCQPADAWKPRVRQEGYLINTGTKIRRAVESDLNSTYPGEPLVKPVLLNKDGGVETNINNALWLPYTIYDSLPYNALGLL